jgi:hypothetical protein
VDTADVAGALHDRRVPAGTGPCLTGLSAASGRKENPMRHLKILSAATLLAVAAAAGAAPPSQAASVNLDGSVSPRTAKGPTLAAAADRQLRKADVPSQKTEPANVKAEADADMDKRDGVAAKPRLKAERRNLKGKDAAHVIAQQKKPSTYDRDISMGDKDHTEQVTDLKVYLKK